MSIVFCLVIRLVPIDIFFFLLLLNRVLIELFFPKLLNETTEAKKPESKLTFKIEKDCIMTPSGSKFPLSL